MFELPERQDLEEVVINRKAISGDPPLMIFADRKSSA